MTIPVTIFSGFLGAGKTTVILNALNQYPNPQRMVMIKNEYGDAGVDGQLLRNSNIAVKELVNGCLCCVLVGSLNDAIDELIEMYSPERIVIEASGNALPFPIVLEIKKNPKVYLDGVIMVVDCLNFSGIKDHSMVAIEQAKYNDLVVFNKVGLVDEDMLYRVKDDVMGLNPNMRSIDTADGVINPDLLFGIPHSIQKWEEDKHVHTHDQMQSTVIRPEGEVDEIKLLNNLKQLEVSKVVRVKGIVKCNDGKWKLINGVFGRFEVRDIETPEGETSRIVFIGKDVSGISIS